MVFRQNMYSLTFLVLKINNHDNQKFLSSTGSITDLIMKRMIIILHLKNCVLYFRPRHAMADKQGKRYSPFPIYIFMSIVHLLSSKL